jgi:serine/threonine protein kinase
LLAWVAGVSPVGARNLLRKVLAWKARDMPGQDNANTLEFSSIADHQLVRRIGGGAYGEVWLARSVLGAYRAVKIVRRSKFESDRPFEREFEGIQHFDQVSRSHPGFVNILHAGRNVQAAYFYYIMDVADDLVRQRQIEPATYVARTLSEEIHTRGRLQLAECIQIGIALSGALAYLHRQGLIHRDIKPSNIIYINGAPRIADVGLVTSVRDQISNYGTPGYIPREGPGTVCADIFALGRVLYQAVSGNSVDQFPALPTNLMDGSDWPRFARLNGIVLKACSADARDRHQTADELHDALVALQTWGTRDGKTATSTTQVVDQTAVRPRQVTLLFKTNAEPDGHLLQLLHQRLLAQGIDVFFDKHLTVGMDWAREIENKIRTADAVVILLSAASVQSEMLAYELEVAHQAAQQQNGRPLRLPVRVQCTEPWPESLEPFLQQVQHFSWDSPADDERLVSELAHALETTQPIPAPDVRPRIEAAGGAVDLASKFYVIRPTDEAFRQAVTRWESIVLVKGARQMGKTSLLARGLDQARQAGARVALSDFQKLSLQNLESAESFYLALAGLLADQFDLDVMPSAVWNRQRSPNINFERFLRHEVLARIDGHLVWGLDEVDRLFACSFGSEVFGLFRSWHNGRALDPSGPWSRLTLAIAYATEAHLFITDVNQSPFNVGTRVDLEDFTFNQVLDLNERHGSPLRNHSELERFHQLLGGQPYLVRRALNELALGNVAFETLVADADRDEGLFGDHLRRMLVMLAKDTKLSEVVRGTLQGRPCPDPGSFYRLRSGGLMRGDSLQEARPRCEIYGSYLKRHLR